MIRSLVSKNLMAYKLPNFNHKSKVNYFLNNSDIRTSAVLRPHTTKSRHSITCSNHTPNNSKNNNEHNDTNLWRNLYQKMVPYGYLMRLDKPIGTLLLYWPCAWSICLSASTGLPDMEMLALFGTGAFIMRGAGCTINDMWDKEIDAKVERTKNRPLVTGAISSCDALIFLSAQLGIGCHILSQLNWNTIILGTSSLGLVVIYPLMKRYTYWPQLLLGMAFNSGALIGWCATQDTILWSACLPLYIAGICWTIIYDTIYAHQDKKDDIALGLKSTAIRFGDNTKIWLSGFTLAMITGLTSTGIACDQTWPYYTSVGLVFSHLVHQIYTLNIDSNTDCANKFVSNHQIGLILCIGIVLGTLFKTNPKNEESKISTENLLKMVHKNIA